MVEEEEQLDRGTIVKQISDGDRFLVCQVGVRRFCLVGMRDGNRWTNPTELRTLSGLTSNHPEDFEVVKHGRDR